MRPIMPRTVRLANFSSQTLQERIMAEPFGGERFTYSLLLVLCNRLTTCSVSLVTLAVSVTAAQRFSMLFAEPCQGRGVERHADSQQCVGIRQTHSQSSAPVCRSKD